MTKDEALKLAKVCIQASLEYKRGSATAVEAVEDIDAMLAQPEQEPWATREDFYLELDRRVKRIRKEMEIKTVTMRCKDYDIALQIIDMHFGHVFVGQVSTTPKRPWVGLTDEDITKIDQGLYPTWKDEVQAVEARLKELNNG